MCCIYGVGTIPLLEELMGDIKSILLHYRPIGRYGAGDFSVMFIYDGLRTNKGISGTVGSAIISLTYLNEDFHPTF